MLIWPNMLPTENKWHLYSNFFGPLIHIQWCLFVFMHSIYSVERFNGSMHSLHRFSKNLQLAILVVVFSEELLNAWQLDCCNRFSDPLPLLFLSRSYQLKQWYMCSQNYLHKKKKVIHVYVLFISVFAVVHGWKSISGDHNLNHTFWIHCKYRILTT